MAESPTTPTAPSTPTPRQTNRTPVAAAPSGTDFDAIVANMERTQAATDSGTYGQLLAEEYPPPDVTVTITTESTEAAPAAMVEPVPPPGLSERGWSTEVVARHPELMAATMAELAADADISPLGTDPIDPTDAAALQQALNQLGSIEVIKANLRNRAAELNGERLDAARAKLATAGEAVKLAVHEAVTEMQAYADTIRATRGEKK